MAFDIVGARKSGVPDSVIADHLANQRGFDIAGARKSGVPDSAVIDWMQNNPQDSSTAIERNVAPVVNAFAKLGQSSIGFMDLGTKGLDVAADYLSDGKVRIPTVTEGIKRTTGFDINEQIQKSEEAKNALIGAKRRKQSENVSNAFGESLLSGVASLKDNPDYVLTALEEQIPNLLTMPLALRNGVVKIFTAAGGGSAGAAAVKAALPTISKKSAVLEGAMTAGSAAGEKSSDGLSNTETASALVQGAATTTGSLVANKLGAKYLGSGDLESKLATKGLSDVIESGEGIVNRSIAAGREALKSGAENALEEGLQNPLEQIPKSIEDGDTFGNYLDKAGRQAVEGAVVGGLSGGAAAGGASLLSDGSPRSKVAPDNKPVSDGNNPNMDMADLAMQEEDLRNELPRVNPENNVEPEVDANNKNHMEQDVVDPVRADEDAKIIADAELRADADNASRKAELLKLAADAEEKIYAKKYADGFANEEEKRGYVDRLVLAKRLAMEAKNRFDSLNTATQKPTKNVDDGNVVSENETNNQTQEQPIPPAYNDEVSAKDDEIGQGRASGVLGYQSGAPRQLPESLTNADPSVKRAWYHGWDTENANNNKQTEPVSKTNEQMQNRDREKAASQIQLTGIVNDPDYDRISQSKSASFGAPMAYMKGDQWDTLPTVGHEETVTGSDGRKIKARYAVVEADSLQASNNVDGSVVPEYNTELAPGVLRALNNGRSAGLKEAYKRGTAGQYREALANDADKLGVDRKAIEGMQSPVLIRVYKESDNVGDMGAWSNQREGLELSPAEKAKTDSRMLGNLDDIVLNDDGDFDPKGNVNLIHRFIKTLPANEASGLTTPKGEPITHLVVDRLRNAMLVSAYGDDNLLTSATETNEDSKNLIRALNGAAARFASIPKNDPIGVKGLVVRSAQMFKKAKYEGTTVEQLGRQVDLTGGFTAEEEAVAQYIEKNIRTPNRISMALKLLAEYAQRVEDTSGSMFGDDLPATKAAAFEFANQRLKQEYGDEAGQFSTAGSAKSEPVRASAPEGANAGGSGGDRAGGGETFNLESYTNEEIAQREAAAQAAADAEAKAARDAENKASADAEVGQFTLTGSDRQADVAASAGQNDLFGVGSTRKSAEADSSQQFNPLKDDAGVEKTSNDKIADTLKKAKAAGVKDIKKLKKTMLAKHPVDGVASSEVDISNAQESNNIINTSKKKYIAGLIKKNGIKKGSPGYDTAIKKLESAYDESLNKALAALPFDQFHEWNVKDGSKSEAMNRKVWEALREEHGIKDEVSAKADRRRKPASGAQTENRATQNQRAERIEDFGEKIGGARKDTAIGGGKNASKKKEGDDGNVMMFSRRIHGETITRHDGDISDQVADDIITLYKELGSDESVFQYDKAVMDTIDDTVFSVLPDGSKQEADDLTLEMAKEEAKDRGQPEVVDVRKYVIPTVETVTGRDNKPILDRDGNPQMQNMKRGAYVYTNVLGEMWVDLSELKKAGGIGGKIYSKVADFAHENGLTFAGDPLGLSDDAMLKRTEHMASGIARRKKTSQFAPHPRQVSPYAKDAKDSAELARIVRPLKWIKGNDRFNQREIIKTAYHNITKIIPELRHAWIDINDGRIYQGGSPIDTPFANWVRDIQAGKFNQDGQRRKSADGTVEGQRAPLDAFRGLFASASIKRQLLANTLAQYAGESEGKRRQVLDRLGAILPDLENLDGRKVFYQRSSDNGYKRGLRDEKEQTFASGLPRNLPVAETTASRTLEKKLNGWRERQGLSGRVRIREISPVSLPKQLNRALAGFTDATGTRVVLFRNLTPEVDDFNGVNFRDGVLYINENSQSPITLTAAHEWVHNLKKTNPSAYQELENEVRRQGRLDAWHERNIKEEGFDRGRDHAIEELTAAAVSDALTDPVFLQKLAERDQSVFRRIAKDFLKFLKTLIDGWKDQGSNEYLQDVEAFRDKLARVLDELPVAKQKPGVIKALFLRVFHGTPHRGIENEGFKLNKIGTGEGAQAYGWGMYFTSMREVAEGYRKALSGALRGWNYSKEAKALGVDNFEDFRREFQTHAMSEAPAAIAARRIHHASIKSRAVNGGALSKLIERFREVAQGQLYSLDLPIEESDLLDWDKPLREQSQKVKDALIRAGLEGVVANKVMNRIHQTGESDGFSLTPRGNGWAAIIDNAFAREAQEFPDKQDAEDWLASKVEEYAAGYDTGASIYKSLQQRFGEDQIGSRQASEYLQSIGIPGLYYLDGNSRNKGEGSHNYVIWNEDLLTPEAAKIEPMYSREQSTKAPHEKQRASGKLDNVKEAIVRTKLAAKTKATLNKWVKKERGLTESDYAAYREGQGELHTINGILVPRLTSKMKKAWKAEYGTDNIMQDVRKAYELKKYLDGDKNAKLTDSIKSVADMMRAEIDLKSAQIVDIISDDIRHLASVMDVDALDAANSFLNLSKSVSNSSMSREHSSKVLSEAVKKAINRVDDAVQKSFVSDFIAKSQQVDSILANKGKYMNRSYQAHNDPDWMSKIIDDRYSSAGDDYKKNIVNHKVYDLAAKDILKGNPQATDKEIYTAIRQILQDASDVSNPMAAFGSSELIKKMGIFKGRKLDDMAGIRNLLGEYNNPVFAFANTMAKQTNIIASHKFLKGVRDNGLESGLFSTKQEGNYQREITGNGMSPLSGLYTTEKYYNTINDVLHKDKPESYISALLHVSALIKAGKTVLSPGTSILNFLSNASNAMSLGHWSPKAVAKTAKFFVDYSRGDKDAEALMDEAGRLGVISGSLFSHEVAKYIKEHHDVLANEKENIKRFMKPARMYVDAMTWFYEFGDNAWKINAYFNELENGVGKTKAADIVANGYPNYSTVPKTVDMLKTVPFISDFPSFVWEQYRVSAHQLKWIADEYKDGNKAKALSAATRFIIARGLLPAAAYAISSANGWDYDEGEEYQQRMMAPWDKNGSFIFMPKDGKGNVSAFNIGRYSMYDTQVKVIKAIVAGEPVQAVKEALSGLASFEMWVDALYAAATGKTSSGALIYSDSDTAGDKVKKGSEFLWTQLAPTVLSKNARDFTQSNADLINHTLEGTPLASMGVSGNAKGRNYSNKASALQLIGVRNQNMNASSGLKNKIIQNSITLKSNQKTVRDLLGSQSYINNAQVADVVLDYLKQYDRANNRISEDARYLISSGVAEKNVVFEALKSANVSKENAARIVTGGQVRWKPSKDMVEYIKDQIFNSDLPADKKREYLSQRIKVMNQTINNHYAGKSK